MVVELRSIHLLIVRGFLFLVDVLDLPAESHVFQQSESFNRHVTERLAAVGCLSLTNYLMTSVILSALFASWGLGLFGHVSRFEAFALGFVPIVLMLVWSPQWLERVGQGPFERLWRAGARLLG